MFIIPYLNFFPEEKSLAKKASKKILREVNSLRIFDDN